MDMKKNTYFILMSILVVSIFVGCTESNESDTSNDSQKSKNIVLIDEQVLIHPIASGENNMYYKGTIKNIGEKNVDQVTVIVSFYNENNTFLFSKSDNVNDLEPDATKNFQVVVKNSNEYFNQINHVDYTFET
jgi:hypothetical protein